MKKAILVAAILLLVVVGCGSDDTDASGGADTAGIRLVAASEGAQIQADPPDGLIVLDVRTPEEFADGHLEGAMMIDFYSPDFADQLADLDPNRPYLLYCRSGNRSGQTTAIMDQLGFANVADIDGGIVAWAEAGLPLSG
ncbi:MAG: rhodanese-like domain-containing protein [Acidimicrobiales bacterium]